MKIIRNPELKRELLIDLSITVVAALIGFLIRPICGMIALAVGLLLSGAHIAFAVQRYHQMEALAQRLDRILHGQDRVLIYATSNRRHLIRETWSDRRDMEYQDDIHHSDTMEEKLSLASRFGVAIYYSKPNAKEYLHIVHELGARSGIDMDEKDLNDEAAQDK